MHVGQLESSDGGARTRSGNVPRQSDSAGHRRPENRRECPRCGNQPLRTVCVDGPAGQPSCVRWYCRIPMGRPGPRESTPSTPAGHTARLGSVPNVRIFPSGTGLALTIGRVACCTKGPAVSGGTHTPFANAAGCGGSAANTLADTPVIWARSAPAGKTTPKSGLPS